jgi:hypothetical protein
MRSLPLIIVVGGNDLDLRETFNIGERAHDAYLPRAEGGVPLFVWRDGALVPIRDFGEARPNDRILDLLPLAQFSKGGSDAD